MITNEGSVGVLSSHNNHGNKKEVIINKETKNSYFLYAITKQDSRKHVGKIVGVNLEIYI